MSSINQRKLHTKSFLCSTELARGTYVKIVAAISGSNDVTAGIAVLAAATDVAAGIVEKVEKTTKIDGTVIYRVTVGLLGDIYTAITAKALSIGATLTHEGTSDTSIPYGVGSSETTLTGTRVTDFTMSATGTGQKQFLGVAISTAAAEYDEIEILVPFGFYSRA